MLPLLRLCLSDNTLDLSVLLISPVCNCLLRATAVSAGLVARERFNKSSVDALGFLRLGTKDIALEFLITGLHFTADRESKDIRLSTLLDLFFCIRGKHSLSRAFCTTALSPAATDSPVAQTGVERELSTLWSIFQMMNSRDV